MRHDPGLAASPQVRYILKMARSAISLPLLLRRLAAGAARLAAPSTLPAPGTPLHSQPKTASRLRLSAQSPNLFAHGDLCADSWRWRCRLVLAPDRSGTASPG